MGNIYRMPVGFGPSWGPRQGPDGRRFNGAESRTTLMTISFVTNADQMARLLPRGFKPAAEPLVTIRTLYNRDFIWLAGRAYNYVEVLFRSVFEGERDKAEGEFVSVMWEGMADACLVGRDEAGHPKLFADVPEPEYRNGSTYGEASWYGFKFYEHEFKGLQLSEWPSHLEDKPSTISAKTPVRFNHKYFPNAENMEVADVDYAVMTPAGAYPLKILESWTGDADFSFHKARWEDLPTFGQISNALAELEVLEKRPATMARVVRGFNDLRDVLKILK